MQTDEKRLTGRAKNAFLTYFENQLSIPKIYLDAEWNGRKVDVIAINRDEVGEVHVVLLFPYQYLQPANPDRFHEMDTAEKLLNVLKQLPAQFKYVGTVDNNVKCAGFNTEQGIREKSFAADGMGRVGFVNIFVPEIGDVQVMTMIKPERFRAKVGKLADEFVQQHEADWEIRA